MVPLKSASFPNSLIYGRYLAIKSTSSLVWRLACAVTLSHDVCWSNLYIICIAYYIKWMENVPDIDSVHLTRVTKKNSSATILLKQVWKQNLIRYLMALKVQNSKLVSSGCFKAVLCRFPCSILFMQPTHICYNTNFPVLIVAFRTKNKNKRDIN